MAITGAPARFPAGRRILTIENAGVRNSEFSLSDELTVSSSDSVFGFLEAGSSVESSVSNDEVNRLFEEEEEEESEGDDSVNSVEENNNYWQNQLNSLQATLWRTTALETGIRMATKEALKEIEQKGNHCRCKLAIAGNNCRNCLMREVSCRIRNAGYNSAICESKWRSSPEIPSGKHTYLDVIDNSNPKKGEVRVIIELNFRAEFEMGRASEDYKQLVSRLPEVFIGKVERLHTLVKTLSSAAKKCMKDKKMHIAPWRKQKYMQAKWFNTCERIVMEEDEAVLDRRILTKSMKTSGQHHPKASMLTMALLNSNINMPCEAGVGVV